MSPKKSNRPPKASRQTESPQKKAKRIMASQGASGEIEQAARSTYAKNMERIKSGRKWLFDRLSVTPQTLELNVRQTQSGHPTLFVKTQQGASVLMHSDKDPLDEAIKHVETVKLDEAEYLIVLGFGLGYHVLEAVKRVPPGCKVLIVEQSADIFKAAMHVADLSSVISRPDVKVFVGTDLHEIMPALQDDFKTFRYHNIKIVIHPPSKQLFPSYMEVPDNLLSKVLKIVQINVNTVRFFSRLWLKHNLLNMPKIVQSPGVESLFGQFAGKPAILVSAGPSLDKNIDLLRRAVGKAVILSTDTCLRPLLAHGIKPDFVQAIDAQPITYRHFSGLDLSDVCLVGVTRLPPEVLDLFLGRVFLCNDSNNKVWKPIEPHFERLGTLGAGPTVAALGFDLARQMGCDPIIFVGQDFSYAYGRAYAEGTMLSNDMLSQLSTYSTMDTLTEAKKAGEQMIRTRDLARKEPLLDMHGRPTEMSDGMQGWLTWFTLEIKRTKAKCINASEAGILTDGVEVMPLDEAILKHCTEPVEAEKIIHAQLGQNRPVGAAHEPPLTRGKEELKTAANKLASIRRQLEKVLSQAESIVSNGSAKEDMKWLQSQRAEGQVCETLGPLIDWHKQRSRDDVGGDKLMLEAQALVAACQFAIDHLAQSEALLKG
ncbi:MAG: motility associated factor glycosyltransferase family protein [Candidatus Coatesbacteria bacterium]|nr:motility associated factor glycosyltransferase family protein [Candidatus Coatesbacteria bacterium]